jgi:Mg-chelatase subunit ChlD
MKICEECGASNADISKFCNECGTALEPVETTSPTLKKSEVKAGIDAKSIARSISAMGENLQSRRKADVMFVLDCTGSMQGEIDAIKDVITAFADSIESDGVRVRVGLIEFRDRLIREEHRALKFAGQAFTSDPTLFRREVSVLTAHGGGDEPESSLDAVMLALRQSFLPDASKVIVLVTDAPPHIPDKETKRIEDVVEEIRSSGVQQFYLVIRTREPNSQIYLKLLEGTRGMAFELGKGDDFRERAEHFKRTLMALGKTISEGTR